MNQSIRFFRLDTDADEPEIVECDELDFLADVEAGGRIAYARHTVRENGVNQVCLTAMGDY